MQNFVGKTKCIVGYMKVANGFTCPKNVKKNTYFKGVDPSELSDLEVFNLTGRLTFE